MMIEQRILYNETHMNRTPAKSFKLSRTASKIVPYELKRVLTI